MFHSKASSHSPQRSLGAQGHSPFVWLCGLTAACLGARRHRPQVQIRAQTPSSSAAPLVPDGAAPWLRHRKYVDKNTWEFDEDATAFAKELIETQWASVGEGLQVLPLQNNLLGGKAKNGPKLVTRQCVRELWEQVFTELKNDYTTKVAIIGNPGIGKSRNLDYGLRLLLGGQRPNQEEKTSAPKDKVIIYECRKDRQVFAFVPPGQDLRGDAVNNSYQVYRIGLGAFMPEDCVALVF